MAPPSRRHWHVLQAAGASWANVTWINGPPGLFERTPMAFSMLPSGHGLVGIEGAAGEQHFFYSRDGGR